MGDKLKLMLFFFLLALLIPVPNFATAGWLSGWQYRRAITITNSASTSLTNYQVKITIDTASLISAGKMRSDGGDIRFTSSDGTTLLSYWIESGINTASTVIWVKVPSIPASSSMTIYIYYGNPSATSQSNGADTFIFFDDFNTLDTEKWYVASGAAYTVSNGVLKITQGAIGLQNPLSFNLNSGYITEARVQYNSNTESYYSGVLGVGSSRFASGGNANGDAAMLYMLTSTSGSTAIVWFAGSGASALWNIASNVNIATLQLNTWYILGDETTPSTAAVWLDYTRKADYSVTWAKNINYIFLGAFRSDGTYNIKDTSYDWVRVRKYVSPEPSASIGSEEIPNNPPTVSIASVSPSSIYRGNYVTISGSASDSDGNVTAVYVNITAPNGALVITNGLANGTTSWSYKWGSSASSQLGYYSVCAAAVDNANAKTQSCSSNAFQVLNNPPIITANGTYGNPAPGRPLTFWVNATDFEDSTLNARITITAPNSSVVVNQASMSFRNDHYEYDFTPDRPGSWGIYVTVTDKDGGSCSVSWSILVTAAPVIATLSVSPSNTSRPASVHIEAVISDSDTPLSQISASFKVYSPSGSLFTQGSLALVSSEGNSGIFGANFTVTTSSEVGLYDIEILASDGTYSTSKTFANVLSVYNVAPSVDSLNLNATELERGKTVKISVQASDPETPAGQLAVRVKVDDPNGTNVLDTIASWNPSTSKYETAYMPAYNAKLGIYTVEATARDPDGKEGGPKRANLTVKNSLPVIKSVTASPSTCLVNSSVTIYVDADDFETLKSELKVRIKVNGAVGNATFSNGVFTYVFNPTQAKDYDVQVNVTDSDGGLASKTYSKLFSAYIQQTTALNPDSPPNSSNLNSSGLLSLLHNFLPNFTSLNELMSYLNSAQALILIIIVVVAFAVLRGSSRRGRASRGRRR